MDDTTIEFYRTLPQVRAALAILADEDALPDGVLQGEVDPVLYPGLIYVSEAVSATLNFNVGPWEDMSTDPAAPDIVYAYLSNSPNIFIETADLPKGSFATAQVVATAPGQTFPINIPLGLRPEGIYWVRYAVMNASTFNTSTSIAQPLVIDRTAPYTGYRGAIPAPVRPADMPATAGKDYFDSHGGIATFTIPDYVGYGKAPGDWILAYVNGSRVPLQLTPPDPANPLDPPEKWVLPADLSFPLSWAVLEPLLPPGGGPFSLYVEMFDAAGNPSRPSATSLPVTISNLPDATNLLPPTIDRAVPGDNLIDRNDTALDNGMVVRIPPYTNFVRGNNGDAYLLTITANGISRNVGPVSLGNGTFPFPIPVSLTELLGVYDVSQGIIPLQVSYVVQRGTSTFPVPPAPAPTSTTGLDLFFPAGPDLDPDDLPGLINRNLLAPHAFGRNADGTFGPIPDQLTRLHANQNAEARVTLWSLPPLPGVRDFIITLYYAGRPVGTQTVSGGVPGQVVTIDILWPTIQAEGNGTKTLAYTVSAVGSTNILWSPPTNVDVQSNFKFLAAPNFLRRAGVTATSQGAVNCDSFLPRTPPGMITVHVPPSAFFVAGDRITVTVQGCSDNAGNVPVPNAIASQQTLPFDAIAFRNGVDVDFPNFLDVMKLIQPNTSFRSVGSLRVSYSANLVPEGITRSDESVVAARAVRVGTGGYYYCDGTLNPVP